MSKPNISKIVCDAEGCDASVTYETFGRAPVGWISAYTQDGKSRDVCPDHHDEALTFG